MSICSFYGPYGNSIQDGLYSFCVQIWDNMAQSICNSIIPSFLALNARCESC